MFDHKLYYTELIVRVFAGILFFFQGYDKVFKIKLKGVINTFEDEARRDHVPHFMLSIFVYITSFVELIGGVFLIIGLCRDYTLALLSADLILVSIAFSISQAMWDTKYVFPRFALIVTLLMMPDYWSLYSADNLFHLIDKP
ncbi:MAG TPA: DoxX family protein [Bacteroidia bacterium]|jgi:uncharacterized membrane protein YphA (DoxX/SURF4 family)|nr:DoxX family protein [Bacteroidia bacterium]